MRLWVGKKQDTGICKIIMQKNCALQLYRYKPVDLPENAMAILVGIVKKCICRHFTGDRLIVGHYSDCIFGQVNMHLKLSGQKGFLVVKRLQDRWVIPNSLLYMIN